MHGALYMLVKEGDGAHSSVSAFVYERVPLFVGLHLSIMVSICRFFHIRRSLLQYKLKDARVVVEAQ